MDSSAMNKGRESDRVIVEKAIRDCTGWAQTKDFGLLESILAHDADFFIFHQKWADTIVGWDQFLTLYEFWKDPRFKATQFDLRDLRITFSRSGDVAWYSAILDDCMEWEGKPFCLKDTRWTGVLEKRDGKWLIVQMHFSFASDKVLEEGTKKKASEEETRELT